MIPVQRPAQLPWLAPQLAALRGARASAHLPCAVLIDEAPGSGGLWLAQWFAQLLFCTRSDAPCGQCPECLRVLRNEHPDLLVVSYFEDPKTGKITTQIRVDQIRELVAGLALSSHGSRGTVAVIHPADAMNASAFNSLLKTLEEPRPGVHIVLVTAAAALLPATVRSRCQRLAVRPPVPQQTLSWLESLRPSPHWPAALDVLGNAPLLALASDPAELRVLRDDVWRALADAQRGRLDVPDTADRWARHDLPALLGCIENCLTSQVLARTPGAAQSAEMRGAAHLPAADLDINIVAAFGGLDRVRELRLLAGTPINKALALERLLWRLTDAASGTAAAAINAG